MSLEPGSITGQDISPNANILGTQIADRTIQLRNLSTDTFGIIKTIPLTLSFTRSSTTFASYVNSVAHNQTFTPTIIADISIDSTLTGTPPARQFINSYVLSANIGGVFTAIGQIYCTVDSTNVYFQVDISTVSSGTYNNSVKIYILQEAFAT